MLARRHFLRMAALLGLMPSVPTLGGCGQPQKETAPPTHNPHARPGHPIIIATWPNQKATAAAMAALSAGGMAVDAAEAGAKVPEADPADRSVGYGGRPDRDGHVTLDACIMAPDGKAGSVAFLQGIKHPISVARRVMEKTEHVMLVGEGARQFAVEQGFEEKEMLTEKSRQEWEEWLKEGVYQPKANIERHDTIGILAIDAQGDLAGACTTSGMAYKMHGRVGDSPIIGAGLYVDNAVGGACATGQGELVMTTLGAFLIVELMRQGLTPQAACEEGVRRIIARYGHTDAELQVGYLALDKEGRHGACSLRVGFAYTRFQQGENVVFESAWLVE